MIEKFRFDYPEMNTNELFIGDRKSDLECARNTRVPFILRARTYNRDLYDSSYSIIYDLFSMEDYTK